MRKTTLTLALAGVLFAVSTALTQPLQTARSTALAGSGTMANYGFSALGWNPANLGLSANPGFSMQLPSFGMALGNNAFSPEYIGETFVEGDTLDQTEIDDILANMDADKLTLYTQLGIPIFGLSVMNYSFGLDATMLSNTSVPADLFEMVFTGPVKDKVYDLGTVEEKTIGYATASFSLAKDFSAIPFTDEFAAGASFKYFLGGAYAELEHKEGMLQITNDKIHASGFYRFLTSKAIGSGVGLDLGAAAKLKYRDLYVGATLGNLIGSIAWDEIEAKEIRFSRHEGLDLDSVSNREYWNTFLTKTDTTYDYDAVTVPLPKYLLLAGDMPYLNGKGDLFLSYYQGLNDAPGQNTTPRLSVGSEFRWIPIVPLRVGVAVGGLQGTEFAGGFGLRLLGYQLDFGASWHRGVLAGAKGFTFSLTNTIGPKFKRDRD